MNHLLQRILGKSIPLLITGTLLASGMAIPGALADAQSPDDPLSGNSGTQLTHRPMDGLAGLRAVSGYRAGGRYCHNSAKQREL